MEIWVIYQQKRPNSKVNITGNNNLSKTLMTHFKIYFNAGVQKFFLNFSLYKNGKSLFNTEIPKGADHLGCLDGIRFLSITWVIMGHCFSSETSIFPARNSSALYMHLAKQFLFQAVNNAFVSVDTFFLLSGTLVSYLMLKELDRYKGRINFPMLYIHRYLR